MRQSCLRAVLKLSPCAAPQHQVKQLEAHKRQQQLILRRKNEEVKNGGHRTTV